MLATGVIGMDASHGEALAAFRAFNYDAIYLRDASRQQGSAVVSMLRALVEYYSAHPTLIPDVANRGPRILEAERRAARRRRIRRGHDGPLRVSPAP